MDSNTKKWQQSQFSLCRTSTLIVILKGPSMPIFFLCPPIEQGRINQVHFITILPARLWNLIAIRTHKRKNLQKENKRILIKIWNMYMENAVLKNNYSNQLHHRSHWGFSIVVKGVCAMSEVPGSSPFNHITNQKKMHHRKFLLENQCTGNTFHQITILITILK